MTNHNLKKRNCTGRGWRNNAELRERYFDKGTGDLRGYGLEIFYDVLVSEKQALAIMKKVMKEMESTTP